MGCPRCAELILPLYGADRRLKECINYMNIHIREHLRDDHDRVRYLFQKLYAILTMMITVGNECKTPIDKSDFVFHSMAYHIGPENPPGCDISEYISQVISEWNEIISGDQQISMVMERLEKFMFIMSKGHPSWFGL